MSGGRVVRCVSSWRLLVAAGYASNLNAAKEEVRPLPCLYVQWGEYVAEARSARIQCDDIEGSDIAR